RHNLAADALSFDDTLNGESVQVSGDVDDLRAVVTNLLDNAIKYSDQDVRVSVEVSKVDEKNVAVRIADRGIGIPRGQLKRIFRRFFCSPGIVMGRVKGTGLGLFIVHSIVQRHGGRVFAESAGAGQGSTFTIQL